MPSNKFCRSVHPHDSHGAGVRDSSQIDGNCNTIVINKVFSEEEKNYAKLKIGLFECWAFSIAVVIGGQFFGWNSGLNAGFGTFVIAVILTGASYICLCWSSAELSSAIPFSGGAFPIIRMSIGFYTGYLAGCCEAIEYIFYAAISITQLATMLEHNFGVSTNVIPVLYLLFFLTSAIILTMGGLLFWRISKVLGVTCIIILIMYFLGSLPWVSNSVYVPLTMTEAQANSTNDTSQLWFIGGMAGFMNVIPLASYFYIGVESLSLCATFVHKVCTLS